ncbi:MAG TPA: glutaredoxin family protein [Vicinamibacterales bacterium]|jgi:glutaredoxin|nr:glutaredoxin family protein [Vicinamibacterales bacterium]
MRRRAIRVTRVTIYSRPDCHLCEAMKTIVEIVARDVPFQLEEIDISTDAVLEARYGLDIPVLEVNGKKAAKYRVAEDELRRILAGRSG